MLKVNTDRIGIDECAKKYGIPLRSFGERVSHYCYSSMRCTLDIGRTGLVTIMTWNENGEFYGIEVEDGCMNLLFDMIKNGDVIKEA